MSLKICAESVRGASHIRSNKPCQDSYRIEKISENVTVLAVADGHGSDSCPFSKSGSKIAVNVFCSVMMELVSSFASDIDLFMTYLNREGELKVAQTIEEEWKTRVWRAHLDNKREKPLDSNGKADKAAVYKMYGTTLLGLLVTTEFIFAFQLGDGDIICISKDKVENVIEADKILGIETHSLSSENAWEKAITSLCGVDKSDKGKRLYLMSTDGFSNSYPSTDAFNETCKDYYLMIGEHGFETVAENLKRWLSETSRLGCGDDITVILLYDC